MDKKAVITGLGMIPVPKEGHVKAKYILSKTLSEEFRKTFYLKRNSYVNMLPLLVENFQNYGVIRSVFTDSSKMAQEKVLVYEGLDYDIEKNGIYISENVVDENNLEIEEAHYSYFLEKYNALIEEYDEVIIDLSHGFRHFPLLAIINVITQSIKNVDKIKHILYAKEIKRNSEYEIIDLIEYIDLAKLSFVLSSFNTNYTVGNDMSFNNADYIELTDGLRIVSTHILANSLKQLIGADTIITKTVSQLNTLIAKEKNIQAFQSDIDKIIEHLNKIQALENEPLYIQLFQLSKSMKERGYLLNAITLLNESIGIYCAELLKNLDSRVNKHIEDFMEQNGNLYEVAHQSKNIIKRERDFVGPFLTMKKRRIATSTEFPILEEELQEVVHGLDYKIELETYEPINSQKKKHLKEDQKRRLKIREHSIFKKHDVKYRENGYKLIIKRVGQNRETEASVKNIILTALQRVDLKELSSLIVAIESLRNNLAHGNSSEQIENVQRNITVLTKQLNSIINDVIWLKKK